MVGNSLPRFCFSGNRKQNRRVTEVRKRTRIDNNNTNLDNIKNIEKKNIIRINNEAVLFAKRGLYHVVCRKAPGRFHVVSGI